MAMNAHEDRGAPPPRERTPHARPRAARGEKKSAPRKKELDHPGRDCLESSVPAPVPEQRISGPGSQAFFFRAGQSNLISARLELDRGENRLRGDEDRLSTLVAPPSPRVEQLDLLSDLDERGGLDPWIRGLPCPPWEETQTPADTQTAPPRERLHRDGRADTVLAAPPAPHDGDEM
jgi:hypothetical protein